MDERSRTAFLRPVVLQNVIMPEGHPIVDAHRQACSLQPHVTWQASAKRRTVAWRRVHADYCLANAVDNWWESGIPDEDIQRLYPTLRALSPREFEVLQLVYGLHRFPEPAGDVRLINTSPDIRRSSRTSAPPGRCSTVTTGSRF